MSQVFEGLGTWLCLSHCLYCGKNELWPTTVGSPVGMLRKRPKVEFIERLRLRLVKPACCWAELRYLSAGHRYASIVAAVYGPRTPLATKVLSIFILSVVQSMMLFTQLSSLPLLIASAVSNIP